MTDYKAFLGNFEPEKKDEKISEVLVAGQAAVMANLGGYAVFVKTDDRKALESVLASKESVADDAKSLESWLAANDVNLVATKTGVEFFAAKGKVALKQLGETLSAMGMGQGDVAKSGPQVYVYLLDAAEKNVSLGAVGLRVDKAGAVRLADLRQDRRRRQTRRRAGGSQTRQRRPVFRAARRQLRRCGRRDPVRVLDRPAR